MHRRLTTGLLAATLLLSACSDESADVPEDQVVRPADDTPSGYVEADLDAVSIAVPKGWRKQTESRPADNIVATAWRGPVVDGTATEGVDVRVITDPQQPADDAARSLAISAMATLGARGVEPEEVVWPDASLASYLAYTSVVRSPQASASPGTTARTPELATRTLVLDLADGRQVQVTALSAESEDVPDQVLSTLAVRAEDG